MRTTKKTSTEIGTKKKKKPFVNYTTSVLTSSPSAVVVVAVVDVPRRSRLSSGAAESTECNRGEGRCLKRRLETASSGRSSAAPAAKGWSPEREGFRWRRWSEVEAEG